MATVKLGKQLRAMSANVHHFLVHARSISYLQIATISAIEFVLFLPPTLLHIHPSILSISTAKSATFLHRHQNPKRCAVSQSLADLWGIGKSGIVTQA